MKPEKNQLKDRKGVLMKQGNQPAGKKSGQKIAIEKIKKTDKGLVISFTKA
ncbi:MAG: hypothetical protein ABH986_03720 [archaeon]